MWKFNKTSISAEHKNCHYELHPTDSYLQCCVESADLLPQAEVRTGKKLSPFVIAIC